MSRGGAISIVVTKRPIAIVLFVLDDRNCMCDPAMKISPPHIAFQARKTAVVSNASKLGT